MQLMTLPQKIGQLLMCGFDALATDAHITEMIQKYDIGGVILFKRNIQSVAQLKALNAALQRANAQQSDIPLMISIDQEGGMVARIESGITYLPGAMALAATQDQQGIRDIYAAVGKELRALGVHINFAPDADVNNNAKNPVIGVRSFGEEAKSVSAMVCEAIRGLKSAALISVVKHFPGHGDTLVDSHSGLPYILHDQDRLDAVELTPFRAAIAAGVPAIMSAHVIVPSLEPEKIPCTLSRRVLTRLLREELGFQGVIFTDCLEMGAIAKYYGVIDGAVRAFEAGADVLLISHTRAYQEGFIETMLQHVASGRISEARIDASVQRILALKKQYHLHKEIASPLCDSKAMALSEKLSLASITLVQDKHHLLPVKPELKTLVITARVIEKTEVDALMSQRGSLGFYLKRGIPCCDEVFITADTSEEESDRVQRKAKGYEQVIVMSYNAILLARQAELINALAKQHSRLIVVSGRLPYDLRSLPHVSTFLVAYENRSEAMHSAAKVLLGKAIAKGKMPVAVLAG